MSVFIGYPSFMAYQMMKGKKGNNDGFPSIPGMIARYSASGLTNEQMAANPVWVDKTGNGRDLQMKNFSWGGMSGVGGYNQNFNQWGYGNLPPALQTYTPHKMELNIPSTLRTGNVYSNLGKEGDIYDFTLNIVGLKDGASLNITKGVVSGNIERIKKMVFIRYISLLKQVGINFEFILLYTIQTWLTLILPSSKSPNTKATWLLMGWMIKRLVNSLNLAKTLLLY